jgi:flagellar biosynthetic protein flhB
MKMTKQEVKDEYKQSEGDPKVKSQQKSRMQQASRQRMMQELPNADVVITNPTHLAVAIRYDKEKHEAPVVVAKGADYLAAKIKETASNYQIEIVENKPLARMLYHNVEIGAEIPPELYQMVAEVLAYVYNLKGKTG